jgi:hypothetical protein
LISNSVFPDLVEIGEVNGLNWQRITYRTGRENLGIRGKPGTDWKEGKGQAQNKVIAYFFSG